MSNNDRQVPQGIWKALFEFAQQLGAQDAVNQTPSSYQQMSEENKKWLEEALSAYVKDTDPVRLMKKDIETLLSLDLHCPNQEEVDAGVVAIEDLTDLCTHLDNASDFHKIGGFRILIPLLVSSSSLFRANAAELIGDLAQNHPYCQQKLQDAKILQVLLELLDTDPDSRVRVKALFGISSLVRSNSSLENDFIQADGLSYLLRALSTDNERLQVKALFFLTHLLPKSPEYKKSASEMGMVDQFVSLLGHISDQGREQVMSALVALIENNPSAIEQCKRTELALKDILEQRMNEISEDPSHRATLERPASTVDPMLPKLPEMIVLETEAMAPTADDLATRLMTELLAAAPCPVVTATCTNKITRKEPAQRDEDVLPPPTTPMPHRIVMPFNWPVFWESPGNPYRPLPLIGNKMVPFAHDYKNRRDLVEKRLAFKKYFKYAWSMHGAYGRANNTTIGDWDSFILTLYSDAAHEIITYLQMTYCPDDNDILCELEIRRVYINMLIVMTNKGSGYPYAPLLDSDMLKESKGVESTEAPLVVHPRKLKRHQQRVKKSKEYHRLKNLELMTTASISAAQEAAMILLQTPTVSTPKSAAKDTAVLSSLPSKTSTLKKPSKTRSEAKLPSKTSTSKSGKTRTAAMDMTLKAQASAHKVNKTFIEPKPVTPIESATLTLSTAKLIPISKTVQDNSMAVASAPELTVRSKSDKPAVARSSHGSNTSRYLEPEPGRARVVDTHRLMRPGDSSCGAICAPHSERIRPHHRHGSIGPQSMPKRSREHSAEREMKMCKLEAKRKRISNESKKS